MKSKSIYHAVLLVLVANSATFSQQPFEEYGYKVKIATLSNGKYLEFFDQDTLVQIGSVILNTLTGRLEYFVENDTSYSEATLQAEVTSRWLSPDPLSEKYYSVSPYTFSANNPVLFVDPNGAEIFVYHWVVDKDGNGSWQQGHMDSKTQKAMEAYAKTKEGRAFLAQYAKAGQKIGGIEFKEDGKYADQALNFKEYNQDSDRRGSTDIYDDGEKINVDISMNTAHMNKENGDERYAITLGHETLLHADRYDDKLIAEYRKGWETHQWQDFRKAKLEYDRNSGPGGINDHSFYINNQKPLTNFNGYLMSLKNVLNPESVEKARKQHDANYENLKKKQ